MTAEQISEYRDRLGERARMIDEIYGEDEPAANALRIVIAELYIEFQEPLEKAELENQV